MFDANVRGALMALMATWCGPQALAQCAPSWQAGPAVPGTNGEVHAIVDWDPDGAGPEAVHTVVAGSFTIVADQWVTNIAMRHTVTGAWSPLGNGIEGIVRALTTTSSGHLVAAGALRAPMTNSPAAVARFDGSTWQVLDGLTGTVHALAQLANGELVCAGAFQFAGGANLARWDGSTWQPVGTGIAGASEIRDVVFVNGMLFASGDLGGLSFVASWDGANWTLLPPVGGATMFPEGGLLPLASGDLLAGFTGAPGIQRWDGSSWSSFAPGAALGLRDMTLDPAGQLVVCGHVFGSLGAPTTGANVGLVGVWNGSAWSALPPSPTGIANTVRFGVGGAFVGGTLQIGEIGAQNLAVLQLGSWNSLLAGFNAPVTVAAEARDGLCFFGGSFRHSPGGPANAIVSFDGNVYDSLGGGLQQPSGAGLASVAAIERLPHGGVVVGGVFASAGGVASPNVATWQAGAWIAMPGLAMDRVDELAVLPSGHVVAQGCLGSVDRTAIWDGATWTELPGLPFQPGWRHIAVLIDGTIAAMRNGIGGCYRWDGGTWICLGAIDTLPRGLTPLRDGSLAVFGSWSGPMATVHLWDGASWTALPTPPGLRWVAALEQLPDGSLIVAGPSAAVADVRLHRWDGATWAPYANPTSRFAEQVESLLVRSSGEVVATGQFQSMDGVVSNNVARFVPPCPATVDVIGTGCAGNGGPDEMLALTPPWRDESFATRVTGLPDLALSLAMIGAPAPPLPLAQVTPLAASGCELMVAPIVNQIAVPVAGIANTALQLPGTASIIGVLLSEQLVTLELSPTSTILQITSSNALDFTVGSY